MKNNPYQAKSDSALVQCFLGGDNRCFTEIVVRHHTHVHNLLHYKLHNPEWEKDAEQETFIILSNEIRSEHYHDTGHFAQYINGIAWNQALRIRRSENHYVHDDTALSNDEQVQEPAEEFFREQSKETALLRMAMKKLSPRYRQVLEFRDFDEMSFKETGLRMDISEASACALHAKAKRRLKVIMENIINERQVAFGRRKRA